MRTLRAAALFAAVTALGTAPAALTTPAYAGAGIEGAAAVAGKARAASAARGKEQTAKALNDSDDTPVRIMATWSQDGKGSISVQPDAEEQTEPQVLAPEIDETGAEEASKKASHAPSQPADRGLTQDVTIPGDLQLDLTDIPGGKKALLCLAMNDYFEARSESLEGRLAVAKVVLNRTKDRRFPRSVCGVVMEKKTIATGGSACQFSWHCDGQSDVPGNDDAWRQSLLLAAAVLFDNDTIEDPSSGSLWFHSSDLRPQWDGAIARFRQIGGHVFYRDSSADGSQVAAASPRSNGPTSSQSRAE